jgi:GNAT superfamily N-acetyltransferase
MPKNPLPTGEEPPKGYESLLSNKQLTDDIRVGCAYISQLASIELAEIEAMRKLAFSSVDSLIGLTNEILSLEQELDLLPGKDASDKLLFRAHIDNVLAGYALVVTGWPQKGAWVIQHLVISPNYRLRGVGSFIVSRIENFARRSEVKASSILAVPLEMRGIQFWKDVGYTIESGRLPVNIDGLDHELIIYRKEL